MTTGPKVRIGELSRRVGVSAELLRAWERRYGLLRPERSTGGFRLYGREDEERVRLMQEHLAQGMSAAEAAGFALSGGRVVEDAPGTPSAAPSDARDRMRAALDRFDEFEAHSVIDELLARFTLETVLRDVLLPYLRELGERWERGEISVAQEHYASALLRGRLLSLSRGWGRGVGPRALLAGAPGEQHDLGLIAFGLALRARGWRVAFLGPDTPVADVTRTAKVLEPDLVVVAATTRRRLSAQTDDLRALARSAPLALAGAGADATVAEQVGGRLLEGDPVSAAEALAAG
jgi:MerR family transcriptional regulator, light-induced transcriptional regulator